jgi:hypothetical protein
MDNVNHVTTTISDSNDPLKQKWEKLLAKHNTPPTVYDDNVKVLNRLLEKYREVEKIAAYNLQIIALVESYTKEIKPEHIEQMNTIFDIRDQFKMFRLLTDLVCVDPVGGLSKLNCIIQDREDFRKELELSVDLMEDLIEKIEHNPMIDYIKIPPYC